LAGETSTPDVAIVTGAGRGIGRELALALGRTTAHVLCISRSSSSERTRDAIRRAGGSADSLTLDLADYPAVERRVRAWVRRAPFARYAVVLAAAQLGPRGPFEATRIRAWERTLRVNVLGNLAVLHAALGAMRAQRFGRIVFLSGGGAAYGFPLFPAYAASKTALARIVENLAADLDGAGDFAAVCLAPGAVETRMLARVRAAGGEVRTDTDASEAVGFVLRFLGQDGRALSGRLVHVRDDWGAITRGRKLDPSLWTLRRVE
jgi:NAD(P)-dependent dehydrogenase (short-subunit alcohol dehydrogenase family)